MVKSDGSPWTTDCNMIIIMCPSRAGFIEDNVIRPPPFSFKLPTANWFRVFVVLNF